MSRVYPPSCLKAAETGSSTPKTPRKDKAVESGISDVRE